MTERRGRKGESRFQREEDIGMRADPIEEEIIDREILRKSFKGTYINF